MTGSSGRAAAGEEFPHSRYTYGEEIQMKAMETIFSVKIKIEQLKLCRLCESTQLESVVNLGAIAMSGFFPQSVAENPPLAPLEVIRCQNCGLGQLKEVPPLAEMYGEHYGYRSGLNQSMIKHLKQTAQLLEGMLASNLDTNSTILDIGSNDGTLLSCFGSQPIKIGIDPTVSKFRSFYKNTDITVPDFFHAGAYWSVSSTPAQIITSIAMFYDLEDPLSFCKDIVQTLAGNGLWHLEVSYTPWVLDNVAYDTICHEHLLYLGVTQLKMMADIIGLKIVRVATNNTNGGSVAITMAHRSSQYNEDTEAVSFFLAKEADSKRYGIEGWSRFASRLAERQEGLRRLLEQLKLGGKRVAGLGASTKGNVLLQTSKVGSDLLQSVGEVNEEKIGKFLPGSLIPIVSEKELVTSRPDYLLLLPWHFREGFTHNLGGFISSGGRLILPLPELEIVG